MKILIVGSDKVYAIENFYAKYLKVLGIDVRQFAAQTIFYDYYQKSILNKLIFRSGFSGILKHIDVLFREAIESFKPTVIWIFKGMEIYPESLRWAKKKGIKLVNYNPDNPFVFTSKGSGNKFVVEALPLYDLHFTYNLEVEKQLKQEYLAKTAYLPFGFDISESLFRECEREMEISKVCFLGNPDNQRASFLRKLAEQGVSIDLYGNSWARFISESNVAIYPPVYDSDFWKVLRKYRVQLNMMRIHNMNSHNMRTFEVPGIGGVMVAPGTAEHEMFFANGKEVFLYNNERDCLSIIKQVLAMSPADAAAIRENARSASLERGYQYKDRAFMALEVIKDL